MANEFDDDRDLNTPNDEALTEKFDGDLNNGLRYEVVEATNILLRRGCAAAPALDDALIAGIERFVFLFWQLIVFTRG